MKCSDCTIQSPTGLYAHPAGNLIMAARAWQSEITLGEGEKTANPKSLMSVLALDVNQGDTIRITAAGVDEEEAIAGVEEFVKKNL